MSTIVFVFNSAHSPLPYKRVREFIDNGYEVEVYAFDRGVPTKNKPEDFSINIVGLSPETMSYTRRIPILLKGLKEVKRRIGKREVILYFLGLDVAFLSKFFFHRSYIYEEADLVHTYFRNSLLRNIFERIDKYVIRKSLISNFTSEGFLDYHYGSNVPENVFVIPNKLSPEVTKYPLQEHHRVDLKNLQIGFVGGFRFKSIYSFTYSFLSKYPNHDFHLFGVLDDTEENKELLKFDNFHNHGPFKNPQDLPSIYSQLDLVLCTYDAEYENVRYAEPNKIYEAIYFETPIIVSNGTFLSRKVERMGIGYSIDPLNNEQVFGFIDGLTEESIEEKQKNARSIGKEYAINNNSNFFSRLSIILK